MKNYKLDSSNIAQEIFDNEAVVINIPEGKYYSVRGMTGVRILELLNSPVTVDSILSVVASEFDETSDTVAREVSLFVQLLAQEKIIIEVATGSTYFNPSKANHVQAYTPLILEIYDDMQELIMIDPIHDVEASHGWPKKKEDS